MGEFKPHAASAEKEATVAYIEERPTGWLVVWRDAETGKKVSRLVNWGGDPDTVGGVVTKQDARRAAEQLRQRKAQTERAARGPLERVRRQNAQDYPDWQADLFIAPGEEKLQFENYVESLIEGGALTESAKHTYRHTLTNLWGASTRFPALTCRFVIPALCRPGRRGCRRVEDCRAPRRYFAEPSLSGKHSTL